MLAGFRLEWQTAQEVIRSLPVLHDQVEAVGRAGFAGRRALKVAKCGFDGLAGLGGLRRAYKVQIVDYVMIGRRCSTCCRQGR